MHGLSLLVGSGGYCPVVEPGLLTGGASRVAEHRLSGRWASAVAAPLGSVVEVHRLSCSTARGIFPDQGLNLCLLHCKADSLPLDPQGSSEHRDLKERKKKKLPR